MTPTKKKKVSETPPTSDTRSLASCSSSPIVSSTPITPRKIRACMASDKTVPILTVAKSSSADKADKVREDGGQKPSTLFQDLTFSINKSSSSLSVTKRITDHGGKILTAAKNCDYIISPFANASRKKCDTRERTIKWLDDSITDCELKPSFVDIMYRPLMLKTKPLQGSIITFDQFDEAERTNLIKVAECLGASSQDMVFAKHRNNSMIASTHLLLKNAEGLQYSTAQQWSIPCVTEDWLWKCVATQSKYPETEYVLSTEDNLLNISVASSACSSMCENPPACAVFPVHSLILCINSPYFKTLISDSGMKETKQRDIVVKVNVGDGKYLQMLIQSFYDQDILRDMEPLDLLKVLEIADRFLCDVFIKRGLAMLKKLNIKTVAQCNVILDHIRMFQSLGSLSTLDTYTSMKQFCSRFLQDTFSHLESNLQQHETFETMTYDTLLLLLQSGRQFLWHENSLIYFVVNWFATDEARQTEENIKSILSECRYEHMSVEFLRDVLSPNHTILSKWDGFITWYIDALAYHAFSQKTRKLREFPHARKSRSVSSSKTDIQNCMIKLSYITDDMFKQSWVNYRNIVYQGYVLTPKLVLTPIEGEEKMRVKLHLYLGSACMEKTIEKFYLEFDVAFAILPTDQKYESSYLFQHSCSTFISKHYRPMKIKFDKKNLVKKSAGCIDSKLYTKFKENGVYAAFAFKSADVSYWPQFMKSFQNLMFASMLDRKSTDKFGQYDIY